MIKCPKVGGHKSEQDTSAESLNNHSRGAKTYDNQTREIQ